MVREFVPKHKLAFTPKTIAKVLPAACSCSLISIRAILIFNVSAARISAESALADGTKMSSARYVPCNSDEFTVEISQS